MAGRAIAKRHSEDPNIDNDNPYIKGCDNGQNFDRTEGVETLQPTRYEKTIKPVLDKVLSFGGLVVLSPVFLVVSAAIVIDDPGPVFFMQKRVGVNGTYFMLHKFRTMKMFTPHDVPTHQLENSDSYITRVGGFLRRTSLDELPQVYDIFRGKMSVIGPRPALWNQEDLVECRGVANEVLPGLTGLAQINGRDELEIPIKAEFDKKYVRELRKSSLSGLLTDARCFIGTIASVLMQDGVVEGGTGAMGSHPSSTFATSLVSGSQPSQPLSPTDREQSKDSSRETDKSNHTKKRGSVGVGKLRPGVPAEDPETDWGFKKTFIIDTERSVKVLITGAGSYIGTSFEEYCRSKYPNIEIVTLDMKDTSWKESPLWDQEFDTVFHVAGIAHVDVGHADPQTQELYYAINTDLAIECAKVARENGVHQFIFMSSMIVYGTASSVGVGRDVPVDANVVPHPTNFYGDSKWQADKGIRAMGTSYFHTAILRPPMIYGKGSKGNYPTLARIAKKTLVFPQVSNKRSMLYIENLAEFLAQLVFSGEGGVYIPQNSTYSNTSEMVRLIASAARKKIRISSVLSPVVKVAEHIPGKVRNLAEKAFGSSWYDQSLSIYPGLDYQKVSFEESIKRTEG